MIACASAVEISWAGGAGGGPGGGFGFCTCAKAAGATERVTSSAKAAGKDDLRSIGILPGYGSCEQPGSVATALRQREGAVVVRRRGAHCRGAKLRRSGGGSSLDIGIRAP